jgi:hypothetical protein
VASANVNKPHPKPPITGPKPGASSTSKVGNKPPVPSTARPPVGTAKPATGTVKPAAAPPGQMDLAAMVSLVSIGKDVIADQTIARQARTATELIIREESQKLEVRSDVQNNPILIYLNSCSTMLVCSVFKTESVAGK